MFRKSLICLVIFALAGGIVAFAADDATTAEEITDLQDQIKDLEKRVMKNERKTALDRINFTGDFRFEANNISTTTPDYFDGMRLQNLMVNTMFYMGATGSQMPPEDINEIDEFIAQNYAQYLYFTDNLTFDWLKQAVGMFPPEQMQGLMEYLLPHTFTPGYDFDNDLLYTSRLRLNINADVYKNVSFSGRLSMYKTWGDSAGVQVFNGQSNSFNIDGNTATVPNSDILRVERAYFDWKNIGGAPIYLSIGRRPSTEGPPLHYRQGEQRQGTPMGSLIDFQFDGITAGWHINEHSTARICYGMGYESGFGNGVLTPTTALKDAWFLGLNWDIYNSDEMLIQTTIARGFDLTDGFGGLVTLPVNPVTGAEIGAPIVMRFTPSENLGDMDIMGLVLTRRDGPVDWFLNYNYNKSHPNDVTTPFGGLFSDPFETPESQTGHMWYVGAKFNFNDDKTAVGVEYNHGSEYWFNFTPAQDDLIGAKTATRGDVFEIYLLHMINKRFQFKLDYIDYSYDYSGSGWHMGAPKDLSSLQILGFPTYSSASMVKLGLVAKF